MKHKQGEFGIVCTVIVAALGCNGLFYQPSHAILGQPRHRYEDVLFSASDGTRLHGWFFESRASGRQKATVVQFHGNAGNVTSHHQQLEWVVEHGYHFLTFDYRGYGSSDAVVPTRDGVLLDAAAALSFAHESLPVGNELPLIVFGQSLGGAVLLRVLADGRRERVAAVVVEGTFHSYQDVAATLIWRSSILLPFTGLAYLLVTDEEAPAPYIAGISPTPLLVIHGTHDSVVHYNFGRAIYDLANEPKTFWTIQGGGHVQAMRTNRYRSRLVHWMDSVLALRR